MDVRDVPVIKWNENVPLAQTYMPENKLEPCNQGECGACWAVASASCAAERLKILLVPSATQDVTKKSQDCIFYGLAEGCNSACEGGYMITGLLYIRRIGLLKSNGIRVKCGPVYRLNLFDTFGVTNQSYIQRTHLTSSELRKSADNIAREIQYRGTVCATFNMFSNFAEFWQFEDESAIYTLSYPNKPNYQNTEGSKSWSKGSMFSRPQKQYFITAHSIVIVGFGRTETGLEYWVCRNSWGSSKNRPHGLFRIARGVNMCGIESDVLACMSNEKDVLSNTDVSMVTYHSSLISPSVRRLMVVIFILLVLIAVAHTANSHKR